MLASRRACNAVASPARSKPPCHHRHRLACSPPPHPLNRKLISCASSRSAIFTHTTWHLIAIAIGACFVGRLHIYIGSLGTNCCRSANDKPPPISCAYMFAMWFSGLRGGVAFALSAVSYAAMVGCRSCLPA